MTPNPFHSNELLKSLSNYPVAKGDLPGHPFHGNQYQDGLAGSIPKGVHTINGENVTIAPGANLANVDLNNANLQGANLNRANLTRADLATANLRGADLFHANLTGANMGWADLTNAQLTRANMAVVNLRGANLTGASLNGADLTGAYLRDANLTGARGDKDTKLPDTHEVVDGFVVRRK
jgi:hypothetical protein